MRTSRVLRWLPALAFLSLALPARADEQSQFVAKVDVVVDVLPNGAGDAKVVLDFAPMTYQFVKRIMPEPSRYLMDLGMRRGNLELASGTTARYDDTTSDAVLELKLLNASRNLGEGKWELAVDPAYEYISDKVEGDRPTFVYYQYGKYTRASGDDMNFRGQFRYRLPAGSTDATWDAAKHLIRYQLARPEGTGPAKISMELDVKPRLMTAIYKVYGRDREFANMWMAKTRFKNEGTSVVKDVRVRYRVEGYSEWSPWERFPEAVPGQTLVSRYHPVLDAKIARLQSTTPAQILCEWSATDLAGQTKSDSDGRKVSLMGGHDLVLWGSNDAQETGNYAEDVINAPFVAAWVTPDDLVIKEFAAMASRVAGGKPPQDEASTRALLKAIYNLWMANGFTYQFPPGLTDKSISFNAMHVQNVKYPRDVLRDKGGTCIDVAICYAAMANALGIKPYLALRPGHCFPMFEVPGGGLIAVEATGATKGGVPIDATGLLAFEKAEELATDDFVKRRKAGQLILVDVQSMWTRGVSSPDLETLPANIIKEWGLSTSPALAPATQPQQQPQPQPPAGNNPQAPQQDPFAGQWTITIQERIEATGQVISYPLVLTIATDGNAYRAGSEAQAEVPTPNGLMTARITQLFEGQRTQEGALLLKGTSKVFQNMSTGMSNNMPVDTILAIVRGGILMGKLTADGQNWVEFQMQRVR